MWPLKTKDIKTIKIGESLIFEGNEETIHEVGVPINETDEKCIVTTLHKDKNGDIFEFKSYIDIKAEKVKMIYAKKVYYGPIKNRIGSKIKIVSIVLIIGIILKFLFNLNIILYILGLLTYEIFEEIYIKRINKKYGNENKQKVATK